VTALRLLGALVLLVAGFYALYELVESPRSAAFAPVVTHGSGRVVALTFDDGPTRGVTDRLLDVLDRERVPGTFFVVGSAARREPELLRRMAAGGHEIEDHSDTHPHLNALLSGAALDAEITAADDAIAMATGRRAHWLRPPYGARNAAVLAAAKRHGMQVVLWSAMLDETSPQAAPEVLVARLLRDVGDGAIVVLHDGDRGRAEPGGRGYEAALAARVIAALRARGYRFVTLQQLADRG
jgi:peptidoglycan/xylan/chitin deacetylase (PgdA/CDA1 family)